jgi:glycosyltransferase involved in cell wall biosynthesis
VVVPVRDCAPLLKPLLSALQAQTAQPAEVIVVDDGSADDTADVAAAGGARLLRSKSCGPYAARDLGWRASTQPLIGFLDARSRPRPEWASAVCQLLGDPHVVVASTQIETLSGPTLAEQVAATQDVFDLRRYVDRPFFLPYVPTCNLVTRRDTLVALDGFAAVRSGADADFCFRAQLHGLGRVAVAPRPLLDWQPRTSLRGLVEQNYRYGRSGARLRLDFESAGADVTAARSIALVLTRIVAHAVATGLCAALRMHDAEVREARRLTNMAHALGYGLVLREQRQAARRSNG